jgi:hypothetical protein
MPSTATAKLGAGCGAGRYRIGRLAWLPGHPRHVDADAGRRSIPLDEAAGANHLMRAAGAEESELYGRPADLG